MGFEAPLALLALAAAGLPIALHLLRRQDLPTRKLPTVALLLRAQAASRRRVRIVDLLLLIVRVLLLALAAFAVARPFVNVTLAYGDGSIASVVIVVDDSMSMAGREPSLLAQASERAADVVSSLPDGSEVAVVMAGAPARVLVSRTSELDVALRALEQARGPSGRGTDLRAALMLAERELAGARHADRRLLVLTDGAGAALEDVELPARLSSRIERLGEGAERANAAIVDARATPDPTTPGRLSVAALVRASELEGRSMDLVLRRGGEELARHEVTIAEGGARATLHAQSDPATAAAELTLEIDDAIAMDDTRGVLLRAPSGARVLIVDGAARGTTPGTEFLAHAIDLAPSEGGVLTRRRVDPETFAAMDASDADVIVFAGVAAPSERAAAKLRQHVEGGGGLLIAPGEGFDPRAYVARLGELLPARPRAAAAAEVRGPRPAPGSELVPAGLESASTQRWLTLEAIEPGSETPLVFDDDTPALVTARRGDGEVALFATSLDDAWTDLPYRPGYLPLVVNLLRQLAPSGSAPEGPVAPGASVTIEPPAGAVRLDVVTPSGERLVHDAPEGAIEITSTTVPGVYRVEVATRERALTDEPRLAFVVAPPGDESDLSLGELPAGAEHASAEPTASVIEKPLAPWLFLLVGLLALVEAALRTRAAQLARRAA